MTKKTFFHKLPMNLSIEALRQNSGNLISESPFKVKGNIKCLDRLLLENSLSHIIKRPARDACLCMGELQAPPAPRFVFLITL